MKPKTILALVFAVACGLVAMVGVQQVLNQNKGEEVGTQTVLFALEDIRPGVLITEENTEFREWPANGVPLEAVVSPEQITNMGALVPIVAGEMLLVSKMADQSELSASSSIPKGYRIISVPVNDTKTHSGMLLPGDRVDLLLTYEVRTEFGPQTKNVTLLEYVEVFAADNQRSSSVSDTKEIKAKTLTLVVTPEQANLIQLATSKGELTFTLRNKEDAEMIGNMGIDEALLAELSGQKFGRTPPAVIEEEPQPIEEPTVHDFLDNQTLETEVAEANPEPTVPIWKVKIYAGEHVIEQEFEDVDPNALLTEESLSSTSTDVFGNEYTAPQQADPKASANWSATLGPGMTPGAMVPGASMVPWGGVIDAIMKSGILSGDKTSTSSQNSEQLKKIETMTEEIKTLNETLN